MPRSNRRRSKFVPKPKQVWRVKQPTRNWLELPSDLMVNILQRIDVIDILENAQRVCTTWHEICKDPAMWRVIYIDNFSFESWGRVACQNMCRLAVDRSQGQLVELTMIGFCDHKLLQYVADRSRQLRRLEIVCDIDELCGTWSKALKKLSLLEELSLVKADISREDIEAAGRCCPLLKTLKVNQKAFRTWDDDDDDDVYDEHEEETMILENEAALAIGKNLPALTHLELIGNNMTNTGLQAILDGCCHLESLDLRGCWYVNLKGDLGKRCTQQIENLKLPRDSLEGWPHIYEQETWSDDEFPGCFNYSDRYNPYFGDDDEYNGCFDYNDYTAAYYHDGIDDFENLRAMMAIMDMFG